MPVWCAHMGTLTFHPWPVRRPDVDHPDELRIDLDPQPGTTFTDAVRVAGVANELLEELGIAATPRPRATGACTSSSGSSPAGSSPTSGTRPSGSAASWPAATSGVTVDWWKEERGERIFVDFNQNNRDRTIASAYSLRPRPGAPVSTPVTWAELAGLTDPRDFNLFTVPDRMVDGDPWSSIDDTATPSSRCCGSGRSCRRGVQLPAGLPEDAGRAAAGAAVQEGRVALGRARESDRTPMSPKGPRRTTATSRRALGSAFLSTTTGPRSRAP